MQEMAMISIDEVRDLAHQLCKTADGKSIVLIQAALMYAYLAVSGVVDDLPEDEIGDCVAAMISQGLGALPPVMNAVLKMTPEERKLATMPVQGTS